MVTLSKHKIHARLDELVELGLGEWLIRVENVLELLDYESQRRRQLTLRRARLRYHRRRLRCIAGYRRQGRNRGEGALIHAPSRELRLGGEGREPYAFQNILKPGGKYRVTGQHRSDVTGGWVSVLDCDVEGSRIFSPVVPTTEYADFDGLSVICNEAPLEDDDDELNDGDMEDWVDADMEDGGVEVVTDAEILRVH